MFQRSHVSIVRSIRQVSLVHDWLRARGPRALPNIATFEPNERAGDAVDLSTFSVTADGDRYIYICRQAGERVRSIYGDPMQERSLHDCLDVDMALAATPIWNTCISMGLPVYSIIALSDLEDCPVTVEQIFLPYTSNDTTADFMIASLHAWSTEGRFKSQGLLRLRDKLPSHWAVVIDPSAPVGSGPAVAGADAVIVTDQSGSGFR
jgi:hypothetical protein